MKIDRTPEEIISFFIEEGKSVLHLGGNNLTEYKAIPDYKQVSIEDLNNKVELPSGYDYVVLDRVLEFVDDPIALITSVKNLSKTTLIYEFKYDDPDWILDENWKKPWSRVGLEFNLSLHFDYMNDIFFGFATVHICRMPYNEETEKEEINAIK